MSARRRRPLRGVLVALSTLVLAGTALAAPAAATPAAPAPAGASTSTVEPAASTGSAQQELPSAPSAPDLAPPRAAPAAPVVAAAAAVSDVVDEPAADDSTVLGPCDTDIAFNEVINCTVNSPSQVRDLTFPGAAGDQVRVRVVVTGGAVNPVTSVLRSGATVCGVTFADEFTCALTAAGTHTLRIDANGSGTGTFATTIQRLNDPVGCKDVAYGITGKAEPIGKAVEIDCFRHDATTGQRWRIRLVETGGAINLHHEVVRPDGTTVCGLNGNTESTCLLDATGQHRIIVRDDNGLDTGDYRVVLEKFPGPTGCAAAAFGAARTLESTVPGSIDCVTFAGSTGDQIRVRAVVSGGAWNPVTDVVAADGQTVCGVTFADEFTCALTSNGNHTVIIRDGAGTGQSTGLARFYLQRLNDPVGCKALAPGADGKTGAIGTAVEIDCLFRAASAGDRWRIRLVETAGAINLHHEVVRPDGTIVCGLNGNTESTCLLDANGQFRILVKDDDGLHTGDYRIVLEKFPGPTGCTLVDFADPGQVEVILSGALACVKFAGASGDQIRVRAVVTGGAWNPVTDVVAKDGQTVCGVTFADEFTCPLTTGGTHAIFFRDGAGTGSSIGTAAIFVQRLNDPLSCPSLAYGPDGSSATINAAVEIDCFRHTASAGQRWRVRVVETGGAINLHHEVVRPDGTIVCGLNGNTESTCLLDANGEFRVLVKDDDGLQTGSYRVVLEKFPSPTGCTAIDFADPGTVEVTLSGAITCVTFAGASADQIRVRAVVTGGAWNPVTDVVAKDGQTVCGVTFADEFTCPLTTGGTHTIIVRDGAGTGSSTGTAAIFVQRLNDPVSCASIAYSPDGSTATINAAVEIDCFRHTASAGQRWRIRVVETGGTANLHHEVVRPDGTIVCGLNGNTESTCLLDANGEFRILVKDDDGLQTGSYRVVLQKFPSPTGCGTVVVGGAVVNGSVTLAGAVACLTFTGSAGDVIQFSVTAGGAWNPITDVVRADGSTLCGPTFSDVFNCTLTTNGTHTVIVRDGAGTGSSTGTYAVELDEV